MTTKSTTPTHVVKKFTFYPILFLGIACVFLLILTILSRQGIRVNTFLAVTAVSAMFGLTMVSFALELAKPLTWDIIWRPLLIVVVLGILCIFSGWLLEHCKPDLAAE